MNGAEVMAPEDIQRLWEAIEKVNNSIQTLSVNQGKTVEQISAVRGDVSRFERKMDALPCTTEQIERIRMEARLQERMNLEAEKLVEKKLENIDDKVGEAVDEKFLKIRSRLIGLWVVISGAVSTIAGWLVACLKIQESKGH